MTQSKKARSTESVVAMLARMEKELKALGNIPKLSRHLHEANFRNALRMRKTQP